jgi:hypothetical protein
LEIKCLIRYQHTPWCLLKINLSSEKSLKLELMIS